jgi:hypothetical protein
LYPGFGRKVLLLTQIDPELQKEYVAKHFKLQTIKTILQNSLSALKIDLDALAFVKAAPTTQNRLKYSPIVYGIDSLQYEAAIYKNRRVAERREIFEVKLSNDGFFYKSTTDPSFQHTGQIANYSRGGSKRWYEMPDGDLKHLLDELKQFAEVFGLSSDFSVTWIYNSELMRMDFILCNEDNSRELTLSLEPGYPVVPLPGTVKSRKYSELRRMNIDTGGNFGSS